MEIPTTKMGTNMKVDSHDISEFENFMKDYELNRLHTDFFSRWATLIVASLSLIAALAWDDTFKFIFVKYFGEMAELSQKFLYATVLTIAAVSISLMLGKFLLKKEEKIMEEKNIAQNKGFTFVEFIFWLAIAALIIGGLIYKNYQAQFQNAPKDQTPNIDTRA